MPREEMTDEELDRGWSKLCKDIAERSDNVTKAEAAPAPKIPRASDFLPTGEDFEGCIAVEVVEGKEILLGGFEFFDTQWGDAMKITAELDGETVIILSWSKVLVKQAHRLETHLPLMARIDRVKKYWKFS